MLYRRACKIRHYFDLMFYLITFYNETLPQTVITFKTPIISIHKNDLKVTYFACDSFRERITPRLSHRLMGLSRDFFCVLFLITALLKTRSASFGAGLVPHMKGFWEISFKGRLFSHTKEWMSQNYFSLFFF